MSTFPGPDCADCRDDVVHFHTRHLLRTIEGPGYIIDVVDVHASLTPDRYCVGINLIGADGLAYRSTSISRHTDHRQAERHAERLHSVLGDVTGR